jgi:hypothetical protein
VIRSRETPRASLPNFASEFGSDSQSTLFRMVLTVVLRQSGQIPDCRPAQTLSPQFRTATYHALGTLQLAKGYCRGRLQLWRGWEQAQAQVKASCTDTMMRSLLTSARWPLNEI